MAWMKRFEIWLVLLLALIGLAWVLWFNPTRDEFDEEVLGDNDSAVAQVEEDLSLRRLVAKRDYGNVRLDIDLKVRNPKPEKLVMSPPKVRLLAGEGREVPGFFLPFEPLPEVSPNSTQEVQLRYWLEEKDLKGTLELQVDGQKLLIKDSASVEIESLKNGEETAIRSVKWAEGLKQAK